MAERRLIGAGSQPNTSIMEIEFKDRETMRKTQFEIPASASVLKAYVNALSETAVEGETPQLEKFYDLVVDAYADKARAGAREQVAAESTIIRRDGKEIDLMTRPVEKAIAAVNAAYDYEFNIGGKVPGAIAATRKKLVEQGKATEVDGAPNGPVVLSMVKA